MYNFFLKNKDLLCVFCVLIWDLYDLYDCLFNGNCGWKRDMYFPSFGLGRIMYSLFNLILMVALCTWIFLFFQNTIKNSSHRLDRTLKKRKQTVARVIKAKK